MAGSTMARPGQLLVFACVAGVAFGMATGPTLLGVGQTPGPYTPRQSDRPSMIEGDEPGFRSIFDGRTLDGWDGDPTYWRVEDGTLVGEIRSETVI